MQTSEPQKWVKTEPLVVAPELRELLEELLEDLGWRVGGDLSPTAWEQLLLQAGAQLDQVFVQACCQALPPDQVDGFITLVQQQAPLRERLVYLRPFIPNPLAVFAGALAQFRERWRVVFTEVHGRVPESDFLASAGAKPGKTGHASVSRVG